MTAEPRDVEDWCGSPVSHEPHPGCSGWPSAEARDFIETAKILAEPYNETIAALEARLAAVDRENAELRNSLEACRNAGESMRTERDDEYERAANLRHDLRQEIASANSEREQARAARSERDDLRAQLAVAQAQLAEARVEVIRLRGDVQFERRDHQDLLGRLEAVYRIACDFGARRPADQALAALSAAPQPEPDDCPACRRDRTKAGVTCHRTPADGWVCERAIPPASDEPARCEHGKTKAHWLDDWGVGLGAVRCPGPAASGTPDGVQR